MGALIGTANPTPRARAAEGRRDLNYHARGAVRGCLTSPEYDDVQRCIVSHGLITDVFDGHIWLK